MDIKDYLHLYFGCELQVKRKNDKEYHTGRMCEISKKSNHGDWVMVWFDDVITVTSNTWNTSSSNAHHFFFKEDEIKPILRPLYDMTEEHTHEIADELKIVTSNVFLWMQAALKGGCCYFDTQVKFINALRKRGYDCDGLIDAGLAIDKTKLI